MIKGLSERLTVELKKIRGALLSDIIAIRWENSGNGWENSGNGWEESGNCWEKSRGLDVEKLVSNR